MKKKILIFTLIFMIFITGCEKDNKDSLNFKKEYESLNNKGYRVINIDDDNPYIKTTPNIIIDMIDKKETFFLYVGDSLCPWCRSVLEKSIEVSKKYNIEKIYYLEIWDDDKNEILRDKYELKDNAITKTIDGTKEYYKLLKIFDSVLSDYTLNDSNNNKIELGEKRIYAPNYFYIKDGKVIKMIEGISDKQENHNDELTEEILKDEEALFEELFKLDSVCSNNVC